MSPSVLVTNPASRPTSAAEDAACCWLSWICSSEGLSGGGGTAPAGTAIPMIRASASNAADRGGERGGQQSCEAGRPPVGGVGARLGTDGC